MPNKRKRATQNKTLSQPPNKRKRTVSQTASDPVGGSNGSAQTTTIENGSLARIKKKSCIKGSGHKQGNRGQSFEHGQDQDNIGCQSNAAAQAVAGSKDGFTSVVGSNENERDYARLKTIINDVVDEVTFFEAWIGLTIEDGSADHLIQSVWQRIQVQWKETQPRTVLRFTQAIKKEIKDRQQYQWAKLARTAVNKILEWYNIDPNGENLSQLVYELLKQDRLLHPKDDDGQVLYFRAPQITKLIEERWFATDYSTGKRYHSFIDKITDETIIGCSVILYPCLFEWYRGTFQKKQLTRGLVHGKYPRSE